MSVYQRGGVFWFDFWWQGRRYRQTTRQQNREDAELVESQLKLRLRREAGGIAVIDPNRTPRIEDWATIYYKHASRKVTRPERIKLLLRVVLRFWGAKPKKDARPDEPYHDRRLLDPITQPMWIEQFETWMASRNIGGQTRNHYRSAMSQLYALAAKPAYRTLTGVQVNPFKGLDRDATIERTVTLSVKELRAWLSSARYHVRLALAIAALAPKLRLRNVLDLRWREHFDPELLRITVHDHKTVSHTGRPLVQPINAQLQRILIDAKKRSQSAYVITYRGEPVHSIRGGLKLAAERAGLTYGRVGGITFHTVRHTMATMLAELGEAEGLRKDLMGHQRIETTQRYTHIRPQYQVEALERLSEALPIEDLVTLPNRRRRTKTVGSAAPTAVRKRAKPRANTKMHARRKRRLAKQ